MLQSRHVFVVIPFVGQVRQLKALFMEMLNDSLVELVGVARQHDPGDCRVPAHPDGTLALASHIPTNPIPHSGYFARSPIEVDGRESTQIDAHHG